MANRLRVGVIGVGNMGSNHARVYAMLRGAELVGVADPDAEVRERLARLYDVHAYADYRGLLSQVDAVSVAVPTALHHSVAMECLRRGRHVLVEKPITHRVDEGEALIAEAEARGLVLQVGHVERFNPAVRELSSLLAGEQVLAMSARRLSPPTPRVHDVDVVLDLLIHDLDIVLALARSPIRGVSAVGTAVRGDDLDLVMAHLSFENGVLADLVASKVTQQRVRELDVTTASMYVAVNYRTSDVTIYRNGSVSAPPRLEPPAYRQEVVIEKPLVPTTEPLYLELEHFLACVAGRVPVATPTEALEVLRLALLIQQQARTGGAARNRQRHGPAAPEARRR